MISVIGKNAQLRVEGDFKEDFVLVITLLQLMVVTIVQLTDQAPRKKENVTKSLVLVNRI